MCAVFALAGEQTQDHFHPFLLTFSLNGSIFSATIPAIHTASFMGAIYDRQ
jgi:hypothetical protein